MKKLLAFVAPSLLAVVFIVPTVVNAQVCPPGYTCIQGPLPAQSPAPTVSPSVNPASIQLDPSSPLTQAVPVTNYTLGTYSGLPIFTFDITAQGRPVVLKGISIPMSTAAATSSGLITAAYIYQGSTLIASIPVAYLPSPVANFGLLKAPIVIPAGSHLPLTLKVDVANVTAPFGISANINPIGVSLQDLNGYSWFPTGSAQGNVTTVMPAGPIISIAGTPVIVKTNITPGGATNQTFQYTATFNLQMTAVGGNVTFGFPSSSFPAVGTSSNYIQIIQNGVPASISNSPIISYSQPANTALWVNGSAFTVAQNQTVAMPVTVSFVVTNPGASVYGVKLNGVGYTFNSQQHIFTFPKPVQSLLVLAPIGELTASVWNSLEQWLQNL